MISQLIIINNITVNSADAPRFAFAVDTTSVIIKVITEGASITDWGGNGTTGGSASFPSVAVFNYSTSGIYNITATNSTSGCATTRRVAVGEATLHPCAVSSAHPAQTGITGDGLETTVSSQDSITTVADYDGNVYAVVQIGTQCWLKSNLRARHFSDGTQIVNGTEAGTVTNDCLLNATSTTVPYYYRPENNSCGRDYSAGVMSNSFGKVSGAYNEKLYGLYYNWSAVMDNKGICPHGWHVPTQAEWNTMIGVVVSENGAESDKYAYLLSEGNDWDSQEYDWNTNSSDPQYKPGWFVELRNASEFSAVLTGLAGGSDSEHGTTDALGRFLNRAHSYAESYFWSSTSNGNDRAVSINLSHLGTQLTFNNKSINSGYSVRCVRDGESGGGVVSDDPTLSVTSDATAALSVCGSTYASVTYTASITNGETGDYNYTWNSVPAGTVDPNHDYSYSVTYTTPGTYTISCTATPKENVTAVDPATMSVTVTVGGCPCTVTSVGTNEVEGSETNTISAVKDAQDQQYRVVKIGSQCWMAQNLRSTSGLTQGTSSSSTDPYYYDNTNSTFALEDRGIYYNWLAVMGDNSASNTNPSGVQGVCPTGWHVPSKAEWEQLETYLIQNNNYWCGNDYHNISKAMASTVGWSNSANSCTPGNDMSGNNTTGFNALPVGDYQANFGNAGLYADFWTSTMSGDNPYHYSITTDQSEPTMEATLLPENKDFGLSVRCVRDAESGGSTPTQPSVTTSAATNVTSATATLAGTITDPDNLVVTKGFQWSLVSGEYEPGDDVTIEVSDDEITYNLTGLSPNTTYYYRAFITTASGTVTGNEVTFTTTSGSVTPPTPTDCGTVTDASGITYNTVVIGSQCWMKENLRTTKYANEDDITEGVVGTEYSDAVYYDDNTSYAITPLVKRGYFYNWAAVMHGEESSDENPSGVQGICPTGWHVPSKVEWEELRDYVKSVNAYLCGGSSNNFAKSLASETDWSTSSEECAPGNNQDDNNSSGFSAVPAGDHNIEWEGFDDETTMAFFWSSSSSSNGAYYFMLHSDWTDEAISPANVANGYSVRCIRDGESGGGGSQTQTDPSVTTGIADPVGETTATLSATITNLDNVEITGKGFEYKRTSDNSYTSVSGTGTGNSFTADLTGLDAGTEYTYHAFITTASGTVTGDDETFTTESGSVTPPTPSGATLSVTSDASSALTVCTNGTKAATYTATVTENATDVSNNYTYMWNVSGDLIKYANGNTCTVIYNKSGDYTVTCIATPKSGSTSLEPVQENVTVTESTGAVPMFGTCESGLTVSLEYWVSQNASMISWGDGAEKTSPAIGDSHVYASAGVYTITAVNNNDGCTWTKVVSVGNAHPCSVSSIGPNESGFGTMINTVTDIDNNPYQVVQIGSQCWMAQNLRTIHFANGDAITLRTGTGGTPDNNPYYCYPTDFDAYDVNTYGLYYNRWAALKGYDGTGQTSDGNPAEPIQGVCPDGWHIPSKSEWEVLVNSVKDEVDGDEYGAGKFAGGCDWDDFLGGDVYDYSVPSNYIYPFRNISGFNALPAGQYEFDWGFDVGQNTEADFWSSSFDFSIDNSSYYMYIYDQSTEHHFHSNRHDAFSVRCVRDPE